MTAERPFTVATPPNIFDAMRQLCGRYASAERFGILGLAV
jgi:hypothetical protein